ncbi:hypothetical protein Back2_25080 [Nocardioides baekrokdamisoli]|uniref:Uncharacterized protein n=1 Tax=Nocardioides baekrokdamisoli TaxID=1804624 RepID=A0A3G9IX11_9ACTN|nr:pilus assembly protein TadG-related protein [Nocardioides baekrokdamisoli]BBH18221.1 hypothetical protein Back2_25080 [Nocardioides baekrokdamisoli]
MGWLRGRTWQQRERGATAVIVALTITFVAIPTAALSIDLGVQRIARKDAQTVADTAALDAARALATNSGLTNSAATTVAQNSSARSTVIAGSSAAGTTVTAVVGTVGSTFVSDHNLGCGSSSSNSYFTAGGSSPNAVLVVVRATVDRFFAQAVGAGSGSVCRSAIAKALPANQCYSVGSFALGVDTNNSIIGPLLSKLGISAAATALSSAGIVNTSVSLTAIATQLGVGTPSALLTQSTTIGQFVAAAITVMTQNGNTASVTALQALQANIGALASQPLQIGRLVNLGTGFGSAADANVNLGTLLDGSLILANGSNALRIPGLDINVPGIGAIQASATVITPPVQGCNGANATSSQVSIELAAQPSGSLGSVLLGGYATKLDVIVTLANATASSDTTAACSPSTMKINVTNQTLANIRIKAHVSNVLGLIQGDVDTGAPGAGTTGSYTLQLPANYTTALQTSSGTLGIDLTNAQTQLTLLGLVSINLGNLLAPLTNQLNTLLSGTLATVLGAAGTTYAGASLLAIPTASCGGSSLAE